MNKRIVWALVLVLASLCAAQDQIVRFSVHAVLVDKDLNQKPVPRLALALKPLDTPSAQEITLKTGFDGKAETRLRPGKYRLTTPQATEFQGKSYTWSQEIVISGTEQTLELSNDNATASAQAASATGDSGDLTGLFDKLKNSVVTVYSERGLGSGFFVDPAGLILTNNHVVQSSDYLAVQFDEKRKVRAKLLAANPDKDIAVLWANPSAFPEAVMAPLSAKGASSIAVGERVFTIGNPFGHDKVLTTGVISKIEPDSITSDLSVNHGNSGGPLFTLKGEVAGLTSALLQKLAKIIPIEDAQPLIAEARKKVTGTPPSTELLPVDPSDKFPAEFLRTMLETEKLERKPYELNMDQFQVWFITPVLNYMARHQQEMAAARKAAERKGDTSQVKPGETTLEEAQSYSPLVYIYVDPKYSRMWSVKFKNGFQRMRLLCGGKEVLPVHPGKGHYDLHDQRGRTVDTTFRGVYTYLPDAFSPSCGTVALEVFSEKEPNTPITRVVDAATVERIWADFEPYRKAHTQSALSQPAKNSP